MERRKTSDPDQPREPRIVDLAEERRKRQVAAGGDGAPPAAAQGPVGRLGEGSD